MAPGAAGAGGGEGVGRRGGSRAPAAVEEVGSAQKGGRAHCQQHIDLIVVGFGVRCHPGVPLVGVEPLDVLPHVLDVVIRPLFPAIVLALPVVQWCRVARCGGAVRAQARWAREDRCRRACGIR